MNKKTKSDVEVFVHKKKEAIIICPQCKLEKIINADKIRDIGHWDVNATCKRCAHTFSVSFNFRKYYRKATSLSGFLFASPESNEMLAEVHVYDVSLTGIGFRVDDIKVKFSEVYTVRFLLDDADGTAVEKEIVVQSVRGNRVGASFAGKSFDKVLNQYILAK